MPEWLIPTLAALIGGGGLGAVLKAAVDAKGSVYTNLNLLIDQLQEDRQHDRQELSESRQEVKGLVSKVDSVLIHLQIEREYSADLYAWGLNGGPPPPPQRRAFQPPSITP